MAESGEPPDIGALIEEKKTEFYEATGELGVTDVRFLGADDEIVLVDVIVDVRPDVIITHWPYDSVTAHANTTQMVLQALDAVSAIRATSPVSMHQVKQIFYHTALGSMNVQENLFPRTPTTVIDISDVATVKQRAMNTFRSQYFSESNPNQWRKIAESVDGAGASFVRVAYAESFVAQYPQACDYIPVPETSLYSAGKSYEAMFEDPFQFLLGR